MYCKNNVVLLQYPLCILFDPPLYDIKVCVVYVEAMVRLGAWLWRNDNLLGSHVREVACLPGDLQNKCHQHWKLATSNGRCMQLQSGVKYKRHFSE